MIYLVDIINLVGMLMHHTILALAGRVQTFRPKPVLPRGKPPDASDFMLAEQAEWKIEKIETEHPMSDKNFRLVFPPNTVYNDVATGTIYLTGDVEGEAKRVVEVAMKMATPLNSHFWWWALVVVFSLGVIGIAWKGKKRKASP